MNELQDAVERIESRGMRWQALYYMKRHAFRVMVAAYSPQKLPPVFLEFGDDLLLLSLRAAEAIEIGEADGQGTEKAT